MFFEKINQKIKIWNLNCSCLKNYQHSWTISYNISKDARGNNHPICEKRKKIIENSLRNTEKHLLCINWNADNAWKNKIFQHCDREKCFFKIIEKIKNCFNEKVKNSEAIKVMAPATHWVTMTTNCSTNKKSESLEIAENILKENERQAGFFVFNWHEVVGEGSRDGEIWWNKFKFNSHHAV